MLSYIKWERGNGADYYIWLTEQIEDDPAYEDLLNFLFHVEFTYRISNDQHREVDGLDLRKRFYVEEGIRGDPFYDIPCSVLEMLIALSLRVETDVMGDPDLRLFWRMLGNLGLLTGYSSYEKIIDIWLSRRFEPDGYGSPFPIPEPYCDERTQEIWAQCMHWLECI